MSHVVAISVSIKDLASLRAAAEELGAIWMEGKTNYAWYGRHVGDYPLPEGFSASDLGKCSHVIRLPGCAYEIGVVAHPQRPGEFTMLYDFWGDGARLKSHFGDGLKRLVQHYGINHATRQARRLGHAVTRHTLPTGAIQLKVHV
jgi:hypothetical protein